MRNRNAAVRGLLYIDGNLRMPCTICEGRSGNMVLGKHTQGHLSGQQEGDGMRRSAQRAVACFETICHAAEEDMHTIYISDALSRWWWQ